MTPRIQVAAPVHRAIGLCDLSRAALVRLLLQIQTSLPEAWPRCRENRTPRHEQTFQWRAAIRDDEGGRDHLFAFAVDDSTPGLLRIVSVRPKSKP